MASWGFGETRVQGEGPLGAKIFAVGEGPGLEEEREGRPFIGSTGKELDRMLSAAGIERQHIRLDNICQFKPFGDKELAFFAGGRPQEKYIEGVARIHNYCREHKPNVVIAIGKWALWGLTMELGITNWRGSIMESCFIPGQKVIPILHPAGLLRGNWRMRPPSIWDLERVKEESATPEINLPNLDITIAETPAQRFDAFREISRWRKFSFDIETFGGKNLACCGFADSPSRAIVIPHTGRETVELFRALLETPAEKTAQNAMFEMTLFACAFGIRVQNVTFDTMLAAHALYPSLPHDLGFLTSFYTRQPYYKEERKIWKKAGDLSILWNYNGKDCCTEFEVEEKERFDLKDQKVWHTAQFMFDLLEPYAEASIKGVRCDLSLLDELARQTDDRILELEALIDKRFGRPINVRSPKQVAEIVYDELKLPVRKRGGSRTTQQEVLVDLAAKSHSQELLAIVNTRRLKKRRSEYVTRDVLDDDLRFRCTYNIGGTKNSRLSSSKTAWETGHNLQNQPDMSRSLYVPDSGKSFLVLDQMQAESVVVAFLAQDDLEISWFETGLDGHLMLAALLLNKDPEDITHDERYLAKRCHHAFNYRMGWMKFVFVVNGKFDETGVSITSAQGKAFREKYLALRLALQGWWQDTITELRENEATLLTLPPFRRKRQFLDQWSDSLINDAIAFKPQATVGDVNHEAVRRYWRDPEMKELRSAGRIDYLLQMHDGNVYQIDDEIFDDVAEKLMQMSLVELDANGQKFTIPIEARRGKRWSKADLSEYGILRG